MGEKLAYAARGRGEKIQITLSKTTMKKLTELCTDKGVKPSAIAAMAIDKFYRVEKGEISNGSK